MNADCLSKKPLLLLLGVGLIIAVPPILEVFHLFQKLDLSNLHNIFAQSKEIRQHLKSLITYGMLLILGFFTLFYTAVSYMVEPRLRKGCLIFLGFIFIGGVGFIFQPNHQVSYKLVNHSLDNVFLDKAELRIKFTNIPEDLERDCQNARAGQVDILITPKFVHIPDYRDVPILFNNQMLISNKAYKLSSDEIKAFLNDKSFIFKVDYPQATLMARDIKGSALKERQDSCKINGIALDLPYDKALWFYFKVQSKNGTPMRVYY